jgi:hypothetical protein
MINWLFSWFRQKTWIVEVEYMDGSKQVIHPHENTEDSARLYAWLFQQEESHLYDSHEEWTELKCIKTAVVKSIVDKAS